MRVRIKKSGILFCANNFWSIYELRICTNIRIRAAQSFKTVYLLWRGNALFVRVLIKGDLLIEKVIRLFCRLPLSSK